MKQPIHSRIKVLIDMLVLMQSKELACCTDTSYLISLKELFHKDWKNIENLRKFIFHHLCEE